jgi:hypothetical protein
MHRISKKVGLALGAVALSLVAVTAFAFWTGSGSGSGTAAVGTSGTVTVAATITDGIAPGTSKPVSFTAANPSNSPIMLTTVHVESIAVDAGHAACVTGDFSVADVTETHQIPAGATAEALPNNGSLAYANTGANQDACKGATLTLTLSTS